MKTTREMVALFSLIDDPDDEVYGTVADKLVCYGKEIIPNLEQLWETVENEHLQERIVQLIHRVHFSDLQQEFLNWRNNRNPELLRGAILVAKYQYPDLNVPLILQQFDQMRRNIWLELNSYLTPMEQVNIYNSILYNYYKLQGHELSERKADHFFVNKMLESKQGNVFSIGVLYLSLCELLDIPVFAIDIPRQFIFAYFDTLPDFYNPNDDTILSRQVSFYIDPSNGMAYTHTDINNYLRKIKATGSLNEYYVPLTPTRIIYKMLEELSLCYRYNQDDARADEVQQLMDVLK